MNVETVTEAFAKFIESNTGAEFGKDLFIAQVPNEAPESIYWLVTSGGSPISRNATREQIKQYFVSVYYRSTKAQDIEKNLFKLEELLNKPSCVQLEGYEVHDISVTQFPQDRDLDVEDRRVGMLQANIKIYKKES